MAQNWKVRFETAVAHAGIFDGASGGKGIIWGDEDNQNIHCVGKLRRAGRNLNIGAAAIPNITNRTTFNTSSDLDCAFGNQSVIKFTCVTLLFVTLTWATYNITAGRKKVDLDVNISIGLGYLRITLDIYDVSH